MVVVSVQHKSCYVSVDIFTSCLTLFLFVIKVSIDTSSSEDDIKACRDVVVHKALEAELSTEVVCRSSSTIYII